jgi:hypothetical protein
MKQRVVSTLAALALLVPLASVALTSPAGATSNRVHLLNAWKSLEADYNKVYAGIQAGNATQAENGFTAYSRDCVYLATFETSFNSTINADIFQIAVVGNAWAWIGYITLAQNTETGDLKTESSKLNAAISKFNRDLVKIGLL